MTKFKIVVLGVVGLLVLVVADFAPLTDLTAWLRLFDGTTLRHAVAARQAVLEPAKDPTEATIRRLIPAAAGVPAEIMAEIGSSQAAPRPDEFVKDPALSVIPMLYKIHPPGLYANHAEEFRFELSKGIPHPSGLSQELSRNQYLGYCSMIQPDRITDSTCSVDDEAAKGSVSFRVPGLWQGKVRYVAERTDGRWRVKEEENRVDFELIGDERSVPPDGLYNWGTSSIAQFPHSCGPEP